VKWVVKRLTKYLQLLMIDEGAIGFSVATGNEPVCLDTTTAMWSAFHEAPKEPVADERERMEVGPALRLR
jgi:hypothetical protein